jgi:hypothetical protein
MFPQRHLRWEDAPRHVSVPSVVQEFEHHRFDADTAAVVTSQSDKVTIV